MKLIIDISDKTYEIIKNMVYFYNSQRSGRGETKEIFTAIKNGIPLEDLKTQIKAINVTYYSNEMVADCIKLDCLDVIEDIERKINNETNN